MSEFEKKTLSYAFFWTWFLAVTSIQWLPEPFEDRNIDTLIVFGGTMVLCILWTVFGLWTKITGTENWYFREDNLTEREKFLSYKATSRTMIAFVAIIGIAWFLWVFSLAYMGIKDELTLDSTDIALALGVALVAFGALKSYVLFFYLRKERCAASRGETSA